MTEPTPEWVEKWVEELEIWSSTLILIPEVHRDKLKLRDILAAIYREVWEMASTAERRRVLEEMRGTCVWKYDDTMDVFETECGRTFCFEYAPPKDNGYKFCPSCGKVLAEKIREAED